MNYFLYGATSDIGVKRESQEDFVHFKELGKSCLLGIVADGTGSRKEYPQPAAIVTMEIIDYIEEIYNSNTELFMQDPEFFITIAMKQANKILGAFKMGNEELFSGYATSITCCLLFDDGRMYVGHSGNTRLYLIRNGMINQLTKDHTKAAELLNEGKIDVNTYHVHPDRLKMTSGIGVVVDPEIQTFTGKIKENDLILLTSDGIHYAIQPNAIAEIVLKSNDCVNASKNLIDAAKNIIKYPDNMSAMIITRNKN